MENKTNWWMIVGIVVVVAVIASLVTLQVTGNVISMTRPTADKTACTNACVAEKCTGLTRTAIIQCRRACLSSCSKVEVYTKDEVDALLADRVEQINETIELVSSKLNTLFESTALKLDLFCTDSINPSSGKLQASCVARCPKGRLPANVSCSTSPSTVRCSFGQRTFSEGEYGIWYSTEYTDLATTLSGFGDCLKL